MKLNLGCGQDYREGYVNVDFSDTFSSGEKMRVDLRHNLLQTFPFEGNSAEEIIFRETLEHFNRHNGLKVLKEIFRVLKPNGILDLSVPPAERQIRLFLQFFKKEVSFKEFEKAHELGAYNFWKCHDDLAGGTAESDGFDGNSHKTFFSKNSLISVLEHVGFKILSIDDNIFVKATK
jgi:ubiquinone/menaquinone biosynthesis C-methylase UbiE